MSGTLGILLIVGIWFLNFGISWLNGRTVGLMWSETKQMGGWTRFMAWMGAIMSASGFTWCYLIVILLGAYYGQPMFLEKGQEPVLTMKAVKVGFDLGYLIIIPGILFSGFMIWIDSLVRAWRERDLPNIGIASWNTFAQMHNTYRAMSGIPEAFGSVVDFFKGDGDGDSDAKSFLIILLVVIVVVAVISGILTTWAIINKYAGTRPLPVRSPNAPVWDFIPKKKVSWQFDR